MEAVVRREGKFVVVGVLGRWPWSTFLGLIMFNDLFICVNW